MKRALCIIFSIVFIALLSRCEDPKTNDFGNSRLALMQIGEQIPMKLAHKWIDDFAYEPFARTMNGDYKISSTNLKTLLETARLGVAFHHAADENGIHHLLLIPMNEEHALWKGQKYYDANSGSEISMEKAQAWTRNYMNAHPSGIEYHFFGLNILKSMLERQGIANVRIVPGVDDKNKLQLILITTKDSNTNGRIQWDEDVETCYDRSSHYP